MAETEIPPHPNPSGAQSQCQECGGNPWKYRCPGCSICTCSLPCVKSHKQRTGCTGKRSLAEPVPMSQFDDNRLLSDYNFLEETKRAADSARRGLSGSSGNLGFQLPTRLKILRSAARRRRTQVLFFPPGMSKREKNQSRFDIRKNTIFWTIEWRFNGTDVILIDHGLDEHRNLSSVLEKHLQPGPWIHQLKPYCDIPFEDLKFFLSKNPKGPQSRYRELNIKAPLDKQMENIVIIEYPVIYVYLPSHSCEFDVEKDAKPVTKDEEPRGSPDYNASAKGTFFREEEIEEGEVPSETKIIDLMDYSKSRQCSNFRYNNGFFSTEKSSSHHNKFMRRSEIVGPKSVSSDRHLSDAMHSTKNSITGMNHMKLSDDVKFDFGQELRDAYSDLVGEINPDDFLCLDGGYNDDYKLDEGMEDPLILDMKLMEEYELEEGEIPSY